MSETDPVNVSEWSSDEWFDWLDWMAFLFDDELGRDKEETLTQFAQLNKFIDEGVVDRQTVYDNVSASLAVLRDRND